ncbi:hypothetical protein ACIBOV_30535 [Micromonospora chersina]|uniref:hypothetical protein n=1 Tax=Micromonospora chersina TaxID=47854 RepID=UPI0037AEDE02
MIDTDFDAQERSRWAGRAEAYARGFGRLCAYPAEALLDAGAWRCPPPRCSPPRGSTDSP